MVNTILPPFCQHRVGHGAGMTNKNLQQIQEMIPEKFFEVL